jgi:gluconate kinase
MTAPPREWTPIHVGWDEGSPVVDWCHTAGVPFDDPFFSQTVERCLRHPFRLLFRPRTGIDALVDAAHEGSGRAPSGFVFHLSRCGSTLVARMLAARGDVLVMSEPGPLEPLLAAREVPDETRIAWLRAMVTALRRPASDRQPHYVIKLDAWAALDLPLLERAFPDVPFVFLYRDPLEVLVSQAGHRGYHMVPFVLDPERVGVDASTLATLSLHEYGAAVLGRICESALASARAGRTLLVDYRELPSAVPDRIARHFGIPVDDARRADMHGATGTHAKNPVLPFSDDSASKRAAATPEMRAAIERWAAEPYAALCRERGPAATRASA